VSKKERASLFFIPFAEARSTPPGPRTLPLVVAVDGSRGAKVLLATISEEGTPGVVTTIPDLSKNLEVKDERVVADGKIQEGNGAFRKWLFCTIGGCAISITCFTGGPTPFSAACLCLTCGGAALGCYSQFY
jgi:hypothetical protein